MGDPAGDGRGGGFTEVKLGLLSSFKKTKKNQHTINIGTSFQTPVLLIFT